MKKILSIFAVVVILTALSAPSAQAGNDERRGTAGASELLVNPWTRSTGWGGVNIANVRGLDAMFNNVAGLAFVNNVEHNNLMLGVGAQLGLEYFFDAIPLQLSLDWRPLFTLIPGTGFGWNSFGLGIRYAC